MRKYLMSTTAIVAVGVVATPAFSAERVKLSLGGYMEQWIGWADNDEDKGRTEYASFDTSADTEIYFQGSTTLDNGIRLSMRVELEGQRADLTNNGIDEAYLDIISPTLGLLRLGEDDDVTALTVVQGPKGKFSHDFDNWVLEAPEAGGNALTKNDNLYSAASNDSAKITYFTPRFAGFQAGASYSPENRTSFNTGSDTVDMPNRVTDDGSAYGLSLSYKGEVMGVGIDGVYGYHHFSGPAGSTARSASGGTGIVNHNVGLNLTYGGFLAGGGYRRTLSKRGLANPASTPIANNDGYGWNAGVQYKTGPYAVGYYHMESSAEGQQEVRLQDKVKLNQLFFDYTVSDGVTIGSALYFVDYDEENKSARSDSDGGWGLALGIILDF